MAADIVPSSAFEFGLSPRGGLALLNAAKAYALIDGQQYVLPDYNLFCLKLQRHGLQRQLNERPADFENRIYSERILSTNTKNDMALIFKAYRTLHYGNQKNNNLRYHYIKEIKAFKIKKLNPQRHRAKYRS